MTLEADPDPVSQHPQTAWVARRSVKASRRLPKGRLEGPVMVAWILVVRPGGARPLAAASGW